MSQPEPKSFIFRQPTKATLADDVRVMLMLSFITAIFSGGGGAAIAEAAAGVTATGRVVEDSVPTIAAAVVMLAAAAAMFALVAWKSYHVVKVWQAMRCETQAALTGEQDNSG